ncbi:MAG TPA: Smr/MutS family protein [Flavobacteriaceae bacterium]|nr:Smr/MutS family protein [Flavobacteriaceae bacterium]MCB9213233.1 Smr/MutS family protein [Alteromonas sp.]HPF10095.1 Smr/MutS family protein [Flavobacteriaceae bacterium]HQU22584.1 Smr/MutS family protein [Flavobacteriaceae bacterium]HQU66409.1 Smr/MutS family protein [Flavobacteriaceae bacterium]
MKTFSTGDRVSVLDEEIFGVVVMTTANEVTVQTQDGFELVYAPDDLILEDSKALRNLDVSQTTYLHKEEEKTRNSARVKPKKRNEPAMEVDLHIHQLIPNEKGMSAYDMLSLQLDTARHKLEFAIQKKIQKIVFIHGVGDGVLRAELEFMLRKYDHLDYYDANYQKYGQGALEVRIFQAKG